MKKEIFLDKHEKKFYAFLASKKIKLPLFSASEEKHFLNIASKFNIFGHLNMSIESTSENVEISKTLRRLFKTNLLKGMLMQRDLQIISKLFFKNNINFVVLKGMGLITHGYYGAGVRFCRDIDILVDRHQLKKSYHLLKEIGYKYINPFSSDSCDYLHDKHQIPAMKNDAGTIVEIHHRATSQRHYQKCPISKDLLANKVFNGHIPIPLPNLNAIHIFYHAKIHHENEYGPIMLFDIKTLHNKNKDIFDDKFLLLKKLGIEHDFKILSEIFSNIELEERVTENIFKKIKKILFGFHWNEKEQKNLTIFSKPIEGSAVKFTSNTILKRFNEIEYKYQTKKYSLKFFLILLIDFFREASRIRF